MQSILVGFNKHNTARVASCWFIIYYRLKQPFILNWPIAILVKFWTLMYTDLHNACFCCKLFIKINPRKSHYQPNITKFKSNNEKVRMIPEQSLRKTPTNKDLPMMIFQCCKQKTIRSTHMWVSIPLPSLTKLTCLVLLNHHQSLHFHPLATQQATAPPLVSSQWEGMHTHTHAHTHTHTNKKSTVTPDDVPF